MHRLLLLFRFAETAEPKRPTYMLRYCPLDKGGWPMIGCWLDNSCPFYCTEKDIFIKKVLLMDTLYAAACSGYSWLRLYPALFPSEVSKQHTLFSSILFSPQAPCEVGWAENGVSGWRSPSKLLRLSGDSNLGLIDPGLMLYPPSGLQGEGRNLGFFPNGCVGLSI